MDGQIVGLNNFNNKKPHAICIPLPAQGHINPILKLAKLLNSKGFHITFVHTQFNYNRLIKSGGHDSLKGKDDFRFETISDGLPESNGRGIHDIPALCDALEVHGRNSLRDLLHKLLLPEKEGTSPEYSEASPPVSCIVSDGVMGFTMDVAEEFGIPEVLFFTRGGCGMLGYLYYEELLERGYFPLKDESYLSNGYLNTTLDWISDMKGIKLRDLPAFVRSTDPNNTMFHYNVRMLKNAKRAKAVILNTFEELEQETLEAIKTNHDFPKQIYTIGPLPLLLHQQNNHLNLESNLWKEDLTCLDWLTERNPNTVLYVNFGSLITITSKQLLEFAWGLANSKYPFVWVIRENLIDGGDEIISEAILGEIEDRGLILDWCPQEEVLKHPSVGGFVTHCGWNSTLESLSFGVPMICWPFFAEQPTNSFYCCKNWGVGSEIREGVERGKFEEVVRDLMEREKGNEMRKMAEEWKRKAEAAVRFGGSSYGNFEGLVEKLKEESSRFREKGREFVELD